MSCQVNQGCCGVRCNTAPCVIEGNVSLADKNWFKTGGVAEYWAEPTSISQMRDVLKFAQEQSLPLFFMGLGANILVADQGFRGMVIRPALTYIESIPLDNTSILVKAGAGASIDAVIEYCLERGISGLEEFSGIPSSVGGALFINLHYYEFLIEHFLHEALIINKECGSRMVVDRAWFEFGYNTSKLQKGNYVVAEATFLLKKVDALTIAYAKGRRAEIIRHRERRYPTAATCGSFFRNFHPHEVAYTNLDHAPIHVAYYLDKVGVRGTLTVGGAQVSVQHANMIVNNGGATSADIIAVARTMQERVKEAFGIIPQPECLLVGFSEYPLL